MTEQDKQVAVKTELKALNKGMTVEEFEDYLRIHKGSLEFKEALAIYKASLPK